MEVLLAVQNRHSGAFQGWLVAEPPNKTNKWLITRDRTEAHKWPEGYVAEGAAGRYLHRLRGHCCISVLQLCIKHVPC